MHDEVLFEFSIWQTTQYVELKNVIYDVHFRMSLITLLQCEENSSITNLPFQNSVISMTFRRSKAPSDCPIVHPAHKRNYFLTPEGHISHYGSSVCFTQDIILW